MPRKSRRTRSTPDSFDLRIRQQRINHLAQMGEQWWNLENRERPLFINYYWCNERTPLSLKVLATEVVRKRTFIAHYVNELLAKEFNQRTFGPRLGVPSVKPFICKTVREVLTDVKKLILWRRFKPVTFPRFEVEKTIKIPLTELTELRLSCARHWKSNTASSQEIESVFQPLRLDYLTAEAIKKQYFVAEKVRYFLIRREAQNTNYSRRIYCLEYAASFKFYDKERKIRQMTSHDVVRWIVQLIKHGQIKPN